MSAPTSTACMWVKGQHNYRMLLSGQKWPLMLKDDGGSAGSHEDSRFRVRPRLSKLVLSVSSVLNGALVLIHFLKVVVSAGRSSWK